MKESIIICVQNNGEIGEIMDTTYNKLIRDNIPEIIRGHGKIPVVRVLDDNDYIAALNEKLQEEVSEYMADNVLEELCDILEVVYAIAKLKGCSESDLDAIRNDKNEKNGKFANRLFLEKVVNKND